VTDQQDSNDNFTLLRHVAELQEALEQATKGIAALATWPLSGMTAEPDTTTAVGPGRGASGKKSTSKSTTKTSGAGRGRSGCGGVGGIRTKTPRPIHVGFVSKWAAGPRIVTRPRNWPPKRQLVLKCCIVDSCPQLKSMPQVRLRESLSIICWTADVRGVLLVGDWFHAVS